MSYTNKSMSLQRDGYFTLQGFTMSSSENFYFNGKVYHKDSLETLVNLLCDHLIKDFNLPSEQFNGKIMSYLNALRLDVFLLRCHKEGLFRFIKAMDPHTLNNRGEEIQTA